MSSRRCIATVAVLYSCSCSCIGATPARLNENATLFHDDLRWGRLPAAEQQVIATLRPRFERDHQAWGRTVHILDLEIESTRIRGNSGLVRVHFLWNKTGETEAHETVIETHWQAQYGGDWICDGEQIVDGDPTLLSAR